MAGRAAPTFLKRQKEQKRVARALAKRAAKQARRENRAAAESDPGLDEELAPESREPDPGMVGGPRDSQAEPQGDGLRAGVEKPAGPEKA